MLLLAAAASLARRARHPQVRRARVKVDQERLAGSADGDRARPLLVAVLVGERLGAGGALRDGGRGLELADLPALGELAGVRLQVAEAALVLAAK